MNNYIFYEIQNQLMEIKLRSYENDLCLCLLQQINQLESIQKIVFENSFSLFLQTCKTEYDNKIKEKEEKKRLKELDDLHDFIRRKKREKK